MQRVCLDQIQRAAHAAPAADEVTRGHDGGGHAAVLEEFLQSPDVAAGLQWVVGDSSSEPLGRTFNASQFALVHFQQRGRFALPLQELRLGAIEEIRRNLNRGFLTSHSFELQCNLPDGTLVRVTYKDNTTWTFELLHPKSEANASGKWRTVESPGRHFSSQETYDHDQFNQGFGAVFGWVDRVNEEMVLAAKAHVGKTTLQDLREQVEAAANNLKEPEKPFTEDELEDWSAQLQRLVGRLSELERQSEIQSGRVEQLTRELESLKKQGTSIPKRTWLRTAGNKVLDLLDHTSKAGLKALAEGAMKALLEYKP